MLGIILWYNAEKSVGLVWCEDQGPLAYIGPEVETAGPVINFHRGTHIRFELEERNGFRTVQRIDAIAVLPGTVDPGQVLASYEPAPERSRLRVVA